MPPERLGYAHPSCLQLEVWAEKDLSIPRCFLSVADVSTLRAHGMALAHPACVNLSDRRGSYRLDLEPGRAAVRLPTGAEADLRDLSASGSGLLFRGDVLDPG